jgi:myo-inositol-1(or 4)-monophosphatase
MTLVAPGDLDAVLALIRDAAIEAARIAGAFFRPGGRTSARVHYKDGGSPVSDADYAADRYLRERLCTAMPDVAWLSEESAASAGRLDQRHVLIVDPIDGTRGFVAGDARWAVSIALVTEGRPTVGVVHAAFLDQSFTAVRGGGAYCNGVAIAGSGRRHLADAVIAAPGNLPRLVARAIPFRIAPKIPSLACRFAHVAAGFLDGCVSSPDSNDWDLAAADLILHEAGCQLTDRSGEQLIYNKRRPVHPALIAAPVALHGELLSFLQRSSD